MESQKFRRFCDALGLGVLDVTAGIALVDTTVEQRAAFMAARAPWMCDEIIAGPAARRRLEQWVAAGAPVPTAYDVVGRLRFLGDSEVRSLVMQWLLERVPAPVTSYVLDNVLIVGTGWSTHGFQLRCAMPPGPMLTLVALSGASRDPDLMRDIALHELAHAWIEAEPAAPVDSAMFENESDFALLKASRDEKLMRQVRAQVVRQEEQADALAQRWGGRLYCTAAVDLAATEKRAELLAKTFSQVATL